MTRPTGESPRRPSRVVISSLTGKPMDWPAEPDEDEAGAPRRTPTADDARITREIPPHWGKGR